MSFCPCAVSCLYFTFSILSAAECITKFQQFSMYCNNFITVLYVGPPYTVLYVGPPYTSLLKQSVKHSGKIFTRTNEFQESSPFLFYRSAPPSVI